MVISDDCGYGLLAAYTCIGSPVAQAELAGLVQVPCCIYQVSHMNSSVLRL